MKKLGKLILAIVGIAICVIYLPSFLEAVKQLNELGWPWVKFLTDVEVRALFSSFFSGCITMLFAASALLSALFGKRLLFMGLLTLIVLGVLIWQFVSRFQAGTLKTPWDWCQVALGFILPIGYVVGSLFIKLGKDK